MTVHGALPPKSDVNLLYVGRGKGGRDIQRVKKTIKGGITIWVYPEFSYKSIYANFVRNIITNKEMVEEFSPRHAKESIHLPYARAGTQNQLDQI